MQEHDRELEIDELWPHKGHLVVKFAGVDSISDAEALIGCELQVPSRERSRLDPGWTYVATWWGARSSTGIARLGRFQDVQFGAGEAPLLIVISGSKEYEIPYAEAYRASADIEHKKICMKLPEGMLEVNAPLTAEEKEQQRISNKKLSS